MRDTLKYKNAVANSKVALVIDDFESVDPPKPRGIKLHGKAEVVERSGYAGAGIYLKILPEIVWSWGIEAPALQGGNPVIKKMRFG